MIDLADEAFASPVVSGAQDSYFHLDTTCSLSRIGVRFRPGGAYPFLGIAATALRNQKVPAEQCFEGIGELRENLTQTDESDRRIDIVEDFLMHALDSSKRVSPAVCRAVSEFQSAGKPMTISDFAQEIGWSRKHYIEVFNREVGMTPKAFQRIARFQKVLDVLGHLGSPECWANLAIQCGYYDQAHFIHEFRAISGITPSMYVSLRSSQNHVANPD